ncbi:MAG: hypothetical protein PHO41_00410 [Eubacteriales bacterium]|nr:hypothetical protein [Eubacteriales bacterium]
MKKRCLALMLVILLLLPVFTPTVMAEGSLEGVDYTRIKKNESLKKEVTFLVGGKEFKGTLMNGKTLSDEEIDKVIRKVMTTYGVTSGMLLAAEAKINSALQYDESRYVDPRVLGELLLSNLGFSNAQQLSEMLTGDRDFPTTADFYIDALKDVALNQLFDIAAGLVVGAGFTKLMGYAKSVAEVGSREYLEYAESNKRAEQAIAAALALEEFYALCNAAIKKEEKENGSAQWSVNCAKTLWTKVSLFGSVEVVQYWRLACDLKRETAPDDDPANWGGTYTGPMKLDIWHEMSEFDKAFLKKFYLSPKLPFVQAAPVFSHKDGYSQPSTLTKTLKNESFVITFDPGMAENGMLEKPFSFNGFEDRTDFWSYHPISVNLAVGPFEDGEFHFSGGGATLEHTLKEKHNFVGEVSDNNRGIHMDLYSWDLSHYGSLTAPYTSERYDNSESGMDRMTIAKDTTVFEDLRIIPHIRIDGVA